MAGVGIYLLSTGGSFKVQKGDALELAGAFFWALHLVLLGKFALRFELIPFAAGQFIVAGFLNLFAGLVLEKPLINAAVIGAIVYTALFSVGIGYTLQVLGQRFTPLTDADVDPNQRLHIDPGRCTIDPVAEREIRVK